MLHTVLIAAHAACGLIALASGLMAIGRRARGMPAQFRVYLGALWLMVLCLVVVVGTDWANLDLPTRSLYAALTLFAFYIGWRGWRGLQNLRAQAPGWQAAYVENVGFTLIALFDGFVIIAALDLGAPIWLVLLIGALGVLVGRRGVGRTTQRVAA